MQLRQKNSSTEGVNRFVALYNDLKTNFSAINPQDIENCEKQKALLYEQSLSNILETDTGEEHTRLRQDKNELEITLKKYSLYTLLKTNLKLEEGSNYSYKPLDQKKAQEIDDLHAEIQKLEKTQQKLTIEIAKIRKENVRKAAEARFSKTKHTKGKSSTTITPQKQSESADLNANHAATKRLSELASDQSIATPDKTQNVAKYTPQDSSHNEDNNSNSQKEKRYLNLAILIMLGYLIGGWEIALIALLLFPACISAKHLINTIWQGKHSRLKKAALLFGYMAAYVAAAILMFSSSVYSTPALVAAALLAIAVQLYYKEKTPLHFRNFCYSLSLMFLCLSAPEALLALGYSVWLFYIPKALFILYVIVNYAYLTTHSSTGTYIDKGIDHSNIAMPIIYLHAYHVLFFLGLISRNDDFKKPLTEIKWRNLVLGIAIGAVALFTISVLSEVALGSIFVAFVGTVPNAFSIAAILITTPFQAYYEEYLFRHKLTEKIKSVYAWCTGCINQYFAESNLLDTELATNSYLVYIITSVFFALVHIASPGRNFSALLTLATTLPIGIIFHKVYADYGIEASTGVHAGHNILLWLDMMPVFVQVATGLPLINVIFLVFAILVIQYLIIVGLSKMTLSPVETKNSTEAVEAKALVEPKAEKSCLDGVISNFKSSANSLGAYVGLVSKSPV